MSQVCRVRGLVLALAFLIGVGLSGGCGGKNVFGGSGGEVVQVQTHYAKTSDGWSLQVDHYEPRTPNPANNPVVLCHGMSYNNLFWDLSSENSLARYLAGKGYDVWTVSLRGGGLSDQPWDSVMRKSLAGSLDPGFLVTAQDRKLGNAFFSEYSMDDHISYDVPAVIRLVKEKTKAKKVHWVGHSMGGMIMLGYLATHQESAKDVGSFVAVSVPMVVIHPLSNAMQSQVDNAGALKAGNKVISTSGDSLVAKVLGKWAPPTVSESLFLNRDNVDDGMLRLLAHSAQESISSGQLEQVLNMAAAEDFYSLDKTVNYTALLGEVVTPSFFMVGQLDNMATVGAVKYTYRQISSEDKAFRLFGRINGDKADYGHDDIIIGRHARAEVFPEILKWLDGHR